MPKLAFQHHLVPLADRLSLLEARISVLEGDTWVQDVLEVLKELEVSVHQLLAEQRKIAEGVKDGPRRTSRRD